MDRLQIATQIAAAIFVGVPFDPEDFERQDEKKDREAMRYIAKVSFMMAEELMLEEIMRINAKK